MLTGMSLNVDPVMTYALKQHVKFQLLKQHNDDTKEYERRKAERERLSGCPKMVSINMICLSLGTHYFH